MKSTQSKTMVAVAAGMALLALPIASFADDDAGTLYKSKCAACHGPDGSGNTAIGKAVGAKDLRSAEAQADETREDGEDAAGLRAKDQ